MEVTVLFLSVTLAVGVFAAVNPYAWSPSGLPSAAPPEVNNYTPPLGVDIPLAGDIWYATNMLFSWFAGVRDMGGAVLNALGVPEAWSRVLSTIIVFLFAVFSINIISGRVLKYSGSR